MANRLYRAGTKRPPADALTSSDEEDKEDETEEEEEDPDSDDELPPRDESGQTALPGGPWAVEEDNTLRKLCAKKGSGNWDDKALYFTRTGRSANSLRQRWAKLVADGTTTKQQSTSSGSSSGGGASGKSRGGGQDADGEDAGRWTGAEDAELRRKVDKGGTSRWHLMSADFSTKRSSGALRRRWYHLREVSGGGGGTGGGSDSDEARGAKRQRRRRQRDEEDVRP